MSDIWILGGTTEGRQLAEACDRQQIPIKISVVSEYGSQVLPQSPWITVIKDPMTQAEMETFIMEKQISLVIDATHPYAVLVTGYASQACAKHQIPYLRVSRKNTGSLRNLWLGAVWVDTVSAAVDYLETTAGSVFVTTGSKELASFQKLDHYRERVYARVLPSKEVIEACEELGIRGSHLIGMQGPFSRDLNSAMLRQIKAKYLVTKEAGRAGGFEEKMEAAAECGVTAVVIGRPPDPAGVTVEEAIERLKKIRAEQTGDLSLNPRTVTLIGIGMGSPEQMTGMAVAALKHSDVLLGAQRMLTSVSSFTDGILKVPCYLSGEITDWLEQNPEYLKIGVVFSGDTGFYSGAKKLADALSLDQRYVVSVIPGISSVAYLCARLKTSWEDVLLTSRHGRDHDLVEELQKHRRVFALLGGENSVCDLCRQLIEAGYETAELSVGERLSYQDEKITTGTPKQLITGTYDALSAVLVDRTT